MMLSDKDSGSYILNQLQKLEEYSKKKQDERFGKSILEKQKTCIFNILENRDIEETILEQALNQIRAQEIIIRKEGDLQVAENLARLNNPEFNIEAIFRKEIGLIRRYLKELFHIYNSQKDMDTERYLKSVQNELRLIADIKEVFNNILNAKNTINDYVKQLSVLKEQISLNKRYKYMGLTVPSNIKLIDPISRYDLEPFLAAYQNYRSELARYTIQLRYTTATADFMRSQFTNSAFFHKPEDRTYILFVSNNTSKSRGITLSRMTFDEKKGWYAHELKHILSYTKMSRLQLTGFSLKYGIFWLMSYIPGLKNLATRGYLGKVEDQTHKGAIEQGVGKELAHGVDYFFNKSDAPAEMKKRYSSVYSIKEHELMDGASKKYFDNINRSLKEKSHSK